MNWWFLWGSTECRWHAFHWGEHRDRCFGMGGVVWQMGVPCCEGTGGSQLIYEHLEWRLVLWTLRYPIVLEVQGFFWVFLGVFRNFVPCLHLFTVYLPIAKSIQIPHQHRWVSRLARISRQVGRLSDAEEALMLKWKLSGPVEVDRAMGVCLSGFSMFFPRIRQQTVVFPIKHNERCAFPGKFPLKPTSVASKSWTPTGVVDIKQSPLLQLFVDEHFGGQTVKKPIIFDMKGWINFDEHPEVFPSRRQGRRWCHQARNGAWRGELLETACRPWDSNSTILSVEISDGMELSINKWRWPMGTSKLRDIFNIRFAPGGFPLDLRYEPRRGGWWISCQPGQRSISSSKALRQVATRGRWPSFWRVESTLIPVGIFPNSSVKFRPCKVWPWWNRKRRIQVSRPWSHDLGKNGGTVKPWSHGDFMIEILGPKLGGLWRS